MIPVCDDNGLDVSESSSDIVRWYFSVRGGIFFPVVFGRLRLVSESFSLCLSLVVVPLQAIGNDRFGG